MQHNIPECDIAVLDETKLQACITWNDGNVVRSHVFTMDKLIEIMAVRGGRKPYRSRSNG